MTVKQATNVLDIFEFFAERGRPATAKEIAENFGWPRSSTFNLIATLAERGYIYEPRRRAGFYPTQRWLANSQRVAEHQPSPEGIGPILRELSAETGETAMLAAPAGLSAIVLEASETEEPVRYFAQPGKKVPIHASAVGRALLLQFPMAERTSLYSRMKFERLEPGLLTSAEDLEAELKLSLDRGYCRNLGETNRDLAGVAVPLNLRDRRLSIGVAGPISRVEGQIEAIAAQISAKLAHLEDIDAEY